LRPRGDSLVPVIGGQITDMACVYAIGPARGTPIKIGYGRDPNERLSTLQIGNWIELKVHTCAWVVDLMLARRLEMACHELLDKAQKRVRGEWFTITPDWAWKTMCVASQKIGVPIRSDREMEQIKQVREDAELKRMLRIIDVTYDRAMVDKKPPARGINTSQ